MQLYGSEIMKMVSLTSDNISLTVQKYFVSWQTNGCSVSFSQEFMAGVQISD